MIHIGIRVEICDFNCPSPVIAKIESKETLANAFKTLPFIPELDTVIK